MSSPHQETCRRYNVLLNLVDVLDANLARCCWPNETKHEAEVTSGEESLTFVLHQIRVMSRRVCCQQSSV